MTARMLPWVRWSSVLGQFALLQLLVQVLTALTGFVLVRSLGKADYALFTLASTLMATMSVFSDSGLNAAVLAVGGQLWQDRPKLRRLVWQATSMRTKIGVWASVIIVPWAGWLLSRSDASIAQSVALITLTLLAFWPGAACQLSSTTLRLHSVYGALQMAELLACMTRLLGTVAFLLAASLSSVTALVVVVAATCVQFLYVRRKEAAILGLDAGEDDFRPQLRRSVRHMMPNSAFQCVQGSLVTWLLALLAGSSEVADLGALSRLAVVFTLVAAPLHHVIAPAFARCEDLNRLRRLFALTLAVFCIFAAAVVVLCWFWPAGPLWILGKQYASLNRELPIYMAGLALSALNGVFWALNFSRGWTELVSWNIVASIAATVVGLLLCDLSTIGGAAIFTCIAPLGSIFLGGYVSIKHLGQAFTHLAT